MIQNFKAAHDRHLNIKKDHIWLNRRDLRKSDFAVLCFTNDIDRIDKLELFSEYFPGNRFVIDNQRAHAKHHAQLYTRNLTSA